MPTRWSVILLVIVMQGMWTTRSASADKLTVRLESDKTEYVVGETVVLQIAVQNESDAELPVWVDELQSEIQIFLAAPGGVAGEFEIGRGLWSYEPSTVPLKPGEQKHYAVRLLYSFGPSTWQKRDSTLAFPATGQYEIHVRYPIPPKREMFESNTIRIHVKGPEGVDAEIWKRLNHERMLRFLQHGQIRPQSEEIPVTAAEILTSVNDSSYHPSLRWALGKHYYHLRTTEGPNRMIPNPEDIENGKLYRKALGIVLQHPSASWEHAVYDHRLYVRRVVYAFPEETPLEEVFALATKQTGIPLEIAPVLNPKRSFVSAKSDITLAEFMRFFTAGRRSTWLRDGRGYRLVPVAKAGKEPSGR